jgi:hypothetical protein
MLNRRLACIVVLVLAAVPAHAQLGGLSGAINKAKKAIEQAKPTQPPPNPNQPPPAQPPTQAPPAQQPPAQQQAVQPGTSAQAGAGDAVELTQQMYSLMTMRDIPQYMEDKFIVPLASAQISSEQSFWKQIGPQDNGDRIYPAKPSITYEWQKLIETQPEFAGGPMLDAFVNNNADWSFLTRNPQWNPNINPAARPVVGLLVFSKEKVDGRQAEFAARELAPVAKRMFQMAVRKLPTHFYFTAELPMWKYDFSTSAIRFNGNQQMPDKIDLMRPVYDPGIKVGVREYYDKLPAKAREGLVYAAGGSGDGYGYWVAQHTMPPGNKPGGWSAGSPEAKWKENFIWGPIPEPTIFALDRQLRITSIPLDVARAEALSKLGGLLTARVFFTADRIELGNPAAPLDRATQTVLYARLERVQLLDRNKSVVATIDATGFLAAKEANAALAAATAPRPAQMSANDIALKEVADSVAYCNNDPSMSLVFNCDNFGREVYNYRMAHQNEKPETIASLAQSNKLNCVGCVDGTRVSTWIMNRGAADKLDNRVVNCITQNVIVTLQKRPEPAHFKEFYADAVAMCKK